MNKSALTLGMVLWVSVVGRSQITAGVSDNLELGEAFVQLYASAYTSGSFEENYDSLDFDQDGVYDLYFIATAGKVADFTGGLTDVGVAHTRFELMVDTLQQIQLLFWGDSISAAKSWATSGSNSLYYGNFVSKFWGISGQLEQYGPWLGHPEAYAGFRVITVNADTLYGWLKVKATVVPNVATASILVDSWAIQRIPPTTHWSDPGRSMVRIFPNPAAHWVTFSSADTGPASIRLYDLRGVFLVEIPNTLEKAQLDLSHYQPGAYYWEICNRGACELGRLIIQR